MKFLLSSHIYESSIWQRNAVILHFIEFILNNCNDRIQLKTYTKTTNFLTQDNKYIAPTIKIISTTMKQHLLPKNKLNQHIIYSFITFFVNQQRVQVHMYFLWNLLAITHVYKIKLQCKYSFIFIDKAHILVLLSNKYKIVKGYMNFWAAMHL